MKKILTIFSLVVAAFAAVSCEDPNKPVDVTVQVLFEDQPFAVSGLEVALTDSYSTYFANTDASGLASFSVPVGAYSASVSYKTSENGVRIAYSGSNNLVLVAAAGMEFEVDLQKVESQQIIIKELYCGGCPKNEGTGAYTNDGYVILYNNSDIEADASNIVITFAAPYNANGTNKYYTNGSLLYENESWIPSYGAIWWFQKSVIIPAYSQIVVAFFGAIDHTATVSASVNLAKSDYYWMSNSGLTAYTNAKYAVSDAIPTDNYLTCSPFTKGNAWALSNTAPAFYIGKMTPSEAKTISDDASNYDATLGTTEAFKVVKFPKERVIDAVEVWSAANIAKSQLRFPASINNGYAAFTNQKGYTIYRNVDKEATEALIENDGKLVYSYAGGTDDVNGSTDPSGIDAEASIKAGAHIIYSETNDSAVDFHQRKTASLK